MEIRQFVLVTHRWLGLATSVILAIVGATGVVLLWGELPIFKILRGLPGRLHWSLALGYVGNVVVDIATALAVILQIGGLVLWWKRKTIVVSRGSSWWRMCFDLHHAIGIICLPLMLILAATAVVMAQFSPTEHPDLWRFAKRLHVGHFGLPIEVLYAIGSLGFVAQGLTGVVVWRKPD